MRFKRKGKAKNIKFQYCVMYNDLYIFIFKNDANDALCKEYMSEVGRCKHIKLI